jgi:hypothetical protein
VIVARLSVQESPSGRYLAGVTTSSWPLAVGTKLVLRRRGDEWELFELAPRATRTPDDVSVRSFILEEK